MTNSFSQSVELPYRETEFPDSIPGQDMEFITSHNSTFHVPLTVVFTNDHKVDVTYTNTKKYFAKIVV